MGAAAGDQQEQYPLFQAPELKDSPTDVVGGPLPLELREDRCHPGTQELHVVRARRRQLNLTWRGMRVAELAHKSSRI